MGWSALTQSTVCCDSRPDVFVHTHTQSQSQTRTEINLNNYSSRVHSARHHVSARGGWRAILTSSDKIFGLFFGPAEAAVTGGRQVTPLLAA
eukprot:1008685-Prymnesium_polylepis.1